MPNQQHHLIIFGGQGAGKGTQAKLLAKRYGLIYLGTGEIFRELAEENTPMGTRVKQILEQGNLVPDDLTDQIVALKLGEIPPSVGFVLDGYPRNLSQAKNFKHTLSGLDRLLPKPVFINLRVPRDEQLKRLRKRRYTEGRYDDTEAGITQRLKIYDEHTQPVLDAVKDWAAVVRINGDQPIEEVTTEIIGKLEKTEKSDG
jgi:adenylate kinase